MVHSMASHEDSSLSSLGREDHVCNECQETFKQPRVLACLHVFCEPCLDKLFQAESEINEGPLGILTCTFCKQETKLSSKGIFGLPPDYVMCNLLDRSAIENMQIVCTSCKAKEKAVARCSDCATFLCPNCVTAHQYMRCFENHKVVSFEDLQNSEDGIAIHKPIFCPNHNIEQMKFFCNSCQIPICNECMLGDHMQPEHHYERIADIEQHHREELANLMAESKSKITFCEDASSTLESNLRDLQQQHDYAREQISDSFVNYRAILEKRQGELLGELQEMHTKQELIIMDMFHNVEKMVEKIEDGCQFTERLLKLGNSIEILSLKRLVGSQLLYLINNTPQAEVNIRLEFVTNRDKFIEAVRSSFGYLKRNELKERLVYSPPAPPSMQSSFDSDRFSLPSNVLGHDSTPLSQVQEFPLTSMVNMSDRSPSRSSASPSLADLIPSEPRPLSPSLNSGPLINLPALAKLGTVTINNQGQILLNGQVVPGLNINNVTGLGQALTSQRIQNNAMEPSPVISGLLNGTGSHRVSSPHLDPGIPGILNGPPTAHLHSNGGLSTSLLSNPGSPTSPTLSNVPGQLSVIPRSSTTKLNAMQIRCKFGQLGPGKSQFNSPHGFCLGIEEDIIVADTNNHRVQVFEKTGDFKYQFGVPGKEEGQLWYPRKVAVMRNTGKFVICDRGNERSRMQIFTKNGHFIKKIAIRYIDIVAGLAITSQGHIVAVDSVSPTVFCVAESGDLLRWFDCSDYMREPSDIAISGKEYFVCDFKGHCVVVFSEEGQFLRRIGCENITNFPNGIDISDAGDVLVGDSHGNRFHVAVFSRDGSLLSEFECPYVKVSRCCGLKITSEGYVVTLAKNNHHVLVLNTLYIT